MVGPVLSHLEALRSNLLVKLGQVTGETYNLPIVLFAPTSRCNSRCVSCDWWRSDGKTDLTLGEIRAIADALPRFGTRLVVFTGGEPLLRPDVMDVADLFRRTGHPVAPFDEWARSRALRGCSRRTL